MYLLPISLIALIAGAMLNSVSAEAETDVPRVPKIIPPAALSEEETPPPPVAVPLDIVEVTPPHLIELQEKLRYHPGQRRAQIRRARRRAGQFYAIAPTDKVPAPSTPRRR